MKRPILLTTLILYILHFDTQLLAQDGHFSKAGHDGFTAALDEIFAVSADKRTARDFVKEFELYWMRPETSAELKDKILLFSDLIHQKKGKAYPDYHQYLSTLLVFSGSNHPQESFNTWHKGIYTLLQDGRYPLRHANRLFELTQKLLESQSLYSTAAVNWTSSSPSFSFLFTDSLYIFVNNTTITCRAQNDSIFVLNTSGEVNMMSGIWKGKGGKITWEQSGLSPERVYATIGEYSIDMSRNQFTIENTEFNNREYFSYPLSGSVHHRLINIRNPENSTYPKFESYEQRYRIDDIQPGFNFEGGFSQHGAKFLGSGTTQNPAVITIFKNDTLFVKAKSIAFALRQDQIVGTNTEITMYLDSGYIYHPGLLFKYMAEIKELHLIRDGEGLSRSPFFNTYHNISMDTEVIKWQIDNPNIELRMITGAATNHAFFESISYFREEFFNQLQGMDAIHPLQGLLNCSRAYKTDKFTARDYANFLRMPENQVRQQILGLSFHGFVGYNVNNDTLVIRDRLRDYLQFRTGEKDYDVIRFKSETPGSQPNAVFDLNNYDMSLNGVSAISISDRQNVVFFPREEKLSMKRDRNFSFDGSIASGMVNLFGNGFIFNYQDFRIDLNVIDSLSMRVETDGFDYYGRPSQRKINNTVSQLSGFLEIDSANNKSGKQLYPDYPRLTSNTNSYVYYDHPNTQNGAYERELFYFMLDPFKIDSINQLTKDNINFRGVLHSGIFPELEETLVVRPDYSLGFKKQSPENGYPIYDNKARFSTTIDLSNEGLKGSGTLEWLTTSASSDDFTFLPNKTVGLAHSFEIRPVEEGIEYPDVQGLYVAVDYKPHENLLIAEMQEEPFSLFSKETSLEGKLTVSPDGLEGQGRLIMPKAALSAARMQLGHHTVMADSSDFMLSQEASANSVNFRTENLLSTINFKTRNGTFTARDAGSKVEFTNNRYLAYISEFSWDMDKNEIYLGASGSSGNRFVSTHRRQDSLDFIVPLALYDVEEEKIFAQEVKEILVADTKMLLNDGKIIINKDAVLDVLDSVTIVLNDSIHRFYHTRVNIEGKNQYQAEGKYDYLNGNKDYKTITFSSIAPSKENKTTAEGTISEQEIFSFDKHFAFKGEVSLTAGNPLLRFKGGVQMLHDCYGSGPQNYLRFDAEIKPDSIMIPIKGQAVNFDFENIYTGFFLNRDSNIIYSSFLEGRIFHSDIPLLSAAGYLYFDKDHEAFTIAEANKIANPDTTGNIMRFHNSGCYVSGFGKINMGLDLEQVKTSAAGSVKHLRTEDSLAITSTFSLDFFLDEATIGYLVNGLVSAPVLNSSPFELPETIARMAELMGKERALMLARELQAYEPIKSLPVESLNTLTFDSLVWTWDSGLRSYLSNGEAYIGWVKNMPINKKAKVKSQIAFSRAGNSLDLYIELDQGRFYFFSYRNGIMQTRSSDQQYNTHVQALSNDERKLKTRLGEKPYSFILAPESRLNRFIRLFDSPEENYDPETNENPDADY